MTSACDFLLMRFGTPRERALIEVGSALFPVKMATRTFVRMVLLQAWPASHMGRRLSPPALAGYAPPQQFLHDPLSADDAGFCQNGGIALAHPLPAGASHKLAALFRQECQAGVARRQLGGCRADLGGPKCN